MARVADYLFAIALTVWVGALLAVGYISAPILFQNIADRSLAGEIAGRQFSVVAWIGIGCAAYLLVHSLFREGVRVFRSASFWLIVVMLLLTLAGHFGIQPILVRLKAEGLPREVMESVVRNRFAAWHGISSVLYLMQSALGLALVTQVFSKRG